MMETGGRPRKARQIDLSQAVMPTTNKPEISIRYDSKVAEGNIPCSRLVEEVAAAASAGSRRPDQMIISELEDESGDLAGTPTLKSTNSTVPVSWSRDGNVRIDMTKLLAVKRFPIPKRTRAHIPVGTDEVEKVGASIILMLSQAHFTPIEPRSKKSEGPKAKQPEGGAGEKAKSSEKDSPAQGA